MSWERDAVSNVDSIEPYRSAGLNILPSTCASPVQTQIRPARIELDAQLKEEIESANDRLESASAQERLQWAIDRFGSRFAFATAFGAEGMVIIHMLAEIDPKAFVFNLETGYQFKETLEMRDRIAERYQLDVKFERPELTVAQYEKLNDGPVHLHDPVRCCRDRKISVLNRVVKNLDAWASAIRRDQSSFRANTPVVGWDQKFGLVKISPLVDWNKKEIWKFIFDNNVPYNPLHDQGFPSIGCAPCTRAVGDGQDDRAGRWSGTAKTECGLHGDD